MIPYAPGGRLSLQQGISFMRGTVQNAGSLWYVPHVHSGIIINGIDRLIPAGGIQFALDGDPSHYNCHLAGYPYDVFCFDVGGNLVLGTTHAWWAQPAGQPYSRTGGYGGYTDVIRNSLGLKVNQGGAHGNAMDARIGTGVNDIVVVPDGQAHFLGTIVPCANGQVNWVLRMGPVASPGLACELGVYNEYNKEPVKGHTQLHVNGLDWSTTASGPEGTNNWQMFGGAPGMRVKWIDGSDGIGGTAERTMRARFVAACTTGHGFIGVGLNKTNGANGSTAALYLTGGQRGTMVASDEAQLLGWNYYQAVCAPDGIWDGWTTNDTITFGTDAQTVLEFEILN